MIDLVTWQKDGSDTKGGRKLTIFETVSGKRTNVLTFIFRLMMVPKLFSGSSSQNTLNGIVSYAHSYKDYCKAKMFAEITFFLKVILASSILLTYHYEMAQKRKVLQKLKIMNKTQIN